MTEAGFYHFPGEPEPERDAPNAQGIEPHAQVWPVPLATEAYHGITGEIVRRIEPETEADPAAVLFQFLTAGGNILGTGAYARVE